MTTYRFCLTCNVQEKFFLFLTYQPVFLVLLQEDDIHDQDHAFVLLHSHLHTRRKDEHVIDMKTFAIRQKSRLFEYNTHHKVIKDKYKYCYKIVQSSDILPELPIHVLGRE